MLRSRTPQGVRGLKLDMCLFRPQFKGRTPQGVRGLKPIVITVQLNRNVSHSARSAWIETPPSLPELSGNLSHSARSAWIETGKSWNLEWKK